MIGEELRQLKTGPKELRKFAWLVGGIFTALGIYCRLRGKPIYPWYLTPGVVLLLMGTAWPAVLKWVYLAWMAVGMTLGLIVSTILLTLLFYLAVLPVGLVARLAGRDFLSLKLDPKAPSYWVPRKQTGPKKPADYEQQF
jgi:hypothetical protein